MPRSVTAQARLGSSIKLLRARSNIVKLTSGMPDQQRPLKGAQQLLGALQWRICQQVVPGLAGAHTLAALLGCHACTSWQCLHEPLAAALAMHLVCHAYMRCKPEVVVPSASIQVSVSSSLRQPGSQ